MKITREHVVGFSCIGFSIAVLCITPSFPKGQSSVNITGPAFFPNLLAFAFIILGIIQLISASRFEKAGHTKTTKSAIPFAQRKRMLPAIEFIFLLIAFIIAFEPLGFYVATILFLFLLMLLLGLKWWKSLLYSLIYTAVIYLLFGILFTIGLPSGILSFLGI